MDGRVVEGAFAACDAQKARALREGGRAKARHLEELAAAGEDAVFVAPVDDILRDRLRDARDVREKSRRSRVEVHADMVDGGFHDGVECGGKLLLIHIVLVLADADGLRVDLHEFGEGILHAPRDGDGAANRHVVFGKFLFRELRGRVDGCARFVRDQVVNGQFVLANEIRREFFRFVRSRAVADGDERHAVLLDECEHLFCRFGASLFAHRKVENAVVDDLPRGTDDGHLAARAVAGIESHDRVAGERRFQEELLEVCTEDMDRLFFGVFCQKSAKLALHGGEEQTFIAVLDRCLQRFAEDGIALCQPVEDFRRKLLMVALERDLEAALLLAAVDGEDAMRGQCAKRLLVVLIHEEGLRVLGLFVERSHEFCPLPKLLAHLLAQRSALGNGLGDDVHRAGERVLRCLYALLRIDELRGVFFRRAAFLFLCENRERQRLKPLFPRDARTRAPLLLEGQVDVLQLLHLQRPVERFLDLGRELSLLLDALFDLLLALQEISEARKLALDGAHLLFVEFARRLLAVARDEGHGVSLVQERDRRLRLLCSDAQSARNSRADVFFFHGNTSCLLDCSMIFYWIYCCFNFSVICLKNSAFHISSAEVLWINGFTSCFACEKLMASKWSRSILFISSSVQVSSLRM